MSRNMVLGVSLSPWVHTVATEGPMSCGRPGPVSMAQSDNPKLGLVVGSSAMADVTIGIATTRLRDLCRGDRGRAPAPMLKTAALLLVAFVALAACHPTITNVNIYPEFGPHYGDGGGG